MSEFPKVTIIDNPETYHPRVFIGNDEFPHVVYHVKADFYGDGEHKVTVEFPASAVEFKSID